MLTIIVTFITAEHRFLFDIQEAINILNTLNIFNTIQYFITSLTVVLRNICNILYSQFLCHYLWLELST